MLKSIRVSHDRSMDGVTQDAENFCSYCQRNRLSAPGCAKWVVHSWSPSSSLSSRRTQVVRCAIGFDPSGAPVKPCSTSHKCKFAEFMRISNQRIVLAILRQLRRLSAALVPFLNSHLST
uniref:Uncharacterized protein n=1 Tax=Ascaris lumbricoides TaxID=6252 RepID=A0A0M3I3Z1_ASCLU